MLLSLPRTGFLSSESTAFTSPDLTARTIEAIVYLSSSRTQIWMHTSNAKRLLKEFEGASMTSRDLLYLVA